MTKVKIGLALGCGAARGWAHIGVIRGLLEAGIVPDIVAGTSIGAVVGGCYAAGHLDEVEEFARSLTRRRVFGYLDFNMSGSGLITGQRLRDRLINHWAIRPSKASTPSSPRSPQKSGQAMKSGFPAADWSMPSAHRTLCRASSSQ